MKILYVGTERAEAQAIATAVNTSGERVTVSLTSSLDRVAKWIDENDGLRVLVVEAQPNGPVWRSVLTYAAGLATALPVVVIVPEEIRSDLQPHDLDAHECVARKPSLLRELPAVITRAIERARERQLEGPARADLELKLARAAATRDMVNEQFREAAIEVERVRLRHSALEHRLADTETALHAGEARAAEQRRSVADLVAERQREFERKISEEIDRRRRVEDTLATSKAELEKDIADAARVLASLTSELAEAHAALHDQQQRHDVAQKTAAAEITERQAHFDREHAEAEATHGNLTAQLREAEEARDQIRREQQSAIADVARLTERETELEGRLKEEREALAHLAAELADRQAHFDRERVEAEATHGGLTAQLREVEEARDQARREQQSAVADITRLTEREAELEQRLKEERETLATLAAELAERQAHFDRERAEAEATHNDLTAQLREVEEVRDQTRRAHVSAVADITRLTEREAALEGQLKEEREARDTVAEQHRAALATAAAELAERQTHFDRERAEAEATRAGLAAQLREVEEARDQARREHESAVADITRLTEREAALEGCVKEERDAHDALVEQHRAALATATAELAERQTHFDRERAESEETRAGLAAQLREVEAARDWARREHESAVGDLARVTEHAAAEREAAARSQTDLEARMSEANEKIERLQQTIDTLRAASLAQADVINTLTRERLARQESLDRLTREHAAALATGENEMKQLQVELQKTRADNHRLFQQAPMPMFRCTKDGVLTQANRMLAMLVGRRSPNELRGAEWAAEIFESANDLSWLIERCLGSKGKESTETTWRRKDGSRLLVRVSVCATSSDGIEATVEDLTPIRVLNDRLGQAHRMEAVGRLATEVAVTCGSLLGGVHQNAQHLLMTDESNPASRHRAEMLLDEISRAAGLLRQLAAYGDEESRKPAMVELRTVVRDVAPVLKRVAGDAVEVQLPAASAPLNVDAGAERIQRLLVNLAAYGRERMPLGGQLKIELGTIVVDRHFAAKHPNVRLGPHALVTVTESRRATRTDEPQQLPDKEAGSSSPGVAVQRRVDLGTLQELVAECGGHLWMTVEPGGDMVVKIRLPLVTSYGEPPRRTFGPRGRVRTLGHWFQH